MIELDEIWIAEPEDMPWVEEFVAQWPIMQHEKPLADIPGTIVFVVPGKLGVIAVVPAPPVKAFEMHVAMDPKVRGATAIRAGKAVVRICRERGMPLFGETPLEHKAARRYAAACGGVRLADFRGKEVRVWV
jgi:hypothetical protein